jgi:hypothetical protein
MLLSTAQNNTASLGLIEGCLTAILATMAFIVPRLGSAWFARIERPFARLARRKGLMVAAVGLATLLLRLALLPLSPIPLPFIPDDFSFLLAADTFAHGRLTNPTPAMWTHFESIHVSMVRAYVRSNLLDAPGLAPAFMGAARRNTGGSAPGRLQLLD